MDWSAGTAQQQFNLVIRSGISDELAGIFHALSENAELAPQRYFPSDIRLLSQLIVCRNYSKTCLELAVMLVALCKQSTGTETALLRLLYPASAAALPALKQHVQRAMQKQQDITGFTLHTNRLGLLNALLELLIYIDGRLLASLAQLVKSNASTDILNIARQLATAWQKCLYQFLEQHLPPAQAMRRYRSIADWLEQQENITTINDAAVMSFWLQKQADPDDTLGFKRYRTAAENILVYVLAADDGAMRQQVNVAQTIGNDIEQGEVSADMLQHHLEVLQPLDVSVLAAPIKCLTRQQMQWLEPLTQFNRLLPRFMLTIIRIRVLGDWQALVIQASRTGNTHNELTPNSYVNWQRQLTLLQDDIKQTLLALHYIVMQVEPETTEQASNFFASGTQQTTNEFAYAQAIKAAKQAFSRLNRDGFRQLPSAGQLCDYQLCQLHLQTLEQLLQQAQQYWVKIFYDEKMAEQKFSADLSIVNNVLLKPKQHDE